MTNSLLHTNQGKTSSLIEENSHLSNFDQIVLEDVPISLLDVGYISSIELSREKTKKEFKHLFDFANRTKEVDFISSNQDIKNLLPSIGEFFKKEISGGLILTLELMEEEKDWRTLFINIPIHKDANWSLINKKVDLFYDDMFELFPAEMGKLNIDLVPYEF